MLYYIANEKGEQSGPHTLAELQNMKLLPDALVWHEGMPQWAKARNIESLKSVIIQLPPPLPIPPPLPVSTSLTPPPPPEPKIDPPKETVPPKEQAPEPKIDPPKETVPPKEQAPKYKYTPAAPTEHYQPKASSKPSGMSSFRKALWIFGGGILLIGLLAFIADVVRKNDFSYNSFSPSGDRADELRHIKNSLNVTSSYRYRNIGGIIDVVVKVDNPTGYPVDDAVVEVRYIKRDGGTHQKEIVSVGSIGEMSSGTASAPNSDRGIKVDVRLLRFRAYGATVHY